MYFCSIDQGTSSTRAIVFDLSEAKVVAEHQIEYESIYPKPGYTLTLLIFVDGLNKILCSS